MKVNNISIYNNTNPQFKALRIKQEAEGYIASMPDKIINKLDSVGKTLANTQFYHLDITKDGFNITHSNGEKLYYPFLIQNVGQALLIKAKQGLSQITKKLKYKTSREVSNLEDRIKKSSTQIERTAEIVKALDDYEKELVSKEEIVEIDLKEPREKKIKLLIQKYGI